MAIRPQTVQTEPAFLGHPMTRRGFLLRSATLTAALGVGATLAGCDGETYSDLVPPDHRPVALAVRELAILYAVTDRIVPGDDDHPGAIALGVPVRIDRELSFHSDRFRQDMIDALRLIEWWPLFTRLSWFTQLPEPAQDEELAGMTTSRFAWRRSAFQGIKFLVTFFHYTQEPAWRLTGYEGPWVPRVKPASLA